jgi:hypothetical protein
MQASRRTRRGVDAPGIEENRAREPQRRATLRNPFHVPRCKVSSVDHEGAHFTAHRVEEACYLGR